MNSKHILLVSLTNKCNLNCLHCGRNKKDVSSLPLKILKKTVLELKKLGINYVSFSGGEPGLHPDFDKILDFLYKNKIQFLITSNGHTITKYKKKLKKHIFLFKEKLLNLSIDGPKDIHEKIRGKGSWKALNSALDFGRKNKLNLVMNLTINKINFKYLKKTLEILKKYKIYLLRISIAKPTPYNKNKKIFLSKKEGKEVVSKLKHLKKNMPFEVSYGENKTMKKFDCNVFLKNSHFLNFDGNMVLCCNLSWYSDKINQNNKKLFLLSDMNKKSFIEYLKISKKTKLQFYNSLKSKKCIDNCRLCFNKLRIRD